VSGSDCSGGDVERRRAWPAEVAGGGRHRGIGGSSCGGDDGELGSGGGDDGELESGEHREGRDVSRDLEVAADWSRRKAGDGHGRNPILGLGCMRPGWIS
jgi:hypothetical protein